METHAEKLKWEYLDIYEGIQLEILSTTRLDEKSDFSTTYLGKVHTTIASKIKAEESFLISEQGYTMGKLLDGTECQVLLDTGVSKSFISNSHYLHNKSTAFSTHIGIQNTEDSSRKWTICKHFVHNSYNNRYTFTQIWNIYFSIRDSWRT